MKRGIEIDLEQGLKLLFIERDRGFNLVIVYIHVYA